MSYLPHPPEPPGLAAEVAVSLARQAIPNRRPVDEWLRDSLMAVDTEPCEDHRLAKCRRIMRRRECHRNAFNFCAMQGEGQRWRYVWGYTLSERWPVPFMHAWVMNTATGRYYDPTGDLYWYRDVRPVIYVRAFDLTILDVSRAPHPNNLESLPLHAYDLLRRVP